MVQGEHESVGLITGANQGLGRAVAEGLARAWGEKGIVYLTGRDRRRVVEASEALARAGVRMTPQVLDVREEDDVARAADLIGERHGMIDFVDSNATARIMPDVPYPKQVANFVNTNNLGATRMIRAFGPLLAPGGRLLITASSFGTLESLPEHLHDRFDADALELDDIDHTMRKYTEAVISGRAAAEGWPEWINIPSKVGQVAAMRAYAHAVRERARRDGLLIAAVCPGLVDTGAATPWFHDMSTAQSPAEAASWIIKLAAEPIEPQMYGELVQHGHVLPWRRPKQAATPATA